MAEIEVFRLSPEVGKCYEHAESTRQTGYFPDERHFTINKPRYVGKYVRSEISGFGDGATNTDYFIDNGKENSVTYSYLGKTCFREVPCPSKFSFFRGLFKKSDEKKGGKSKRRKTIKNKKRIKTKRRILKRK